MVAAMTVDADDNVDTNGSGGDDVIDDMMINMIVTMTLCKISRYSNDDVDNDNGSNRNG